MTRTLEPSAHLEVGPDRVWKEVNRLRLRLHVAAPVTRFPPVDLSAFPKRWSDGDHLVSMRLVGSSRSAGK
ncbi:hypothetical protein [Hasllibacter halocynthiae]|uniref:hypothetical protein n=1 Tax=Hasllibacter halocynthiae TaxID=595589 RepID=UPI0011B1D1DE|nr:hypothetical protein [Hasllibacter halocynthiae]